MSLAKMWTTSSDQLRDKHIQQIISFAGKGKLLDGSVASLELREFLEIIPLDILRGYAEGCLQSSFPDNGLALQDIVSEIGRRLEFEIERGPYRGIKGKVGFDGIWRSDDGRAIVVEVKTSDTYRIELDRLADYRKKLIASGTIPQTDSSILIVVGSSETEDLEAQVRGSRHAWEVRLISAQALLKLLDIKVRLEDPLVVQQIRSILTPQEYTRVDGIIDLVFLAAEDVTTESTSPGEGGEEVETEEDEKRPVDFNDECAERIQRHFKHPLVKQSRVTWKSPDNSLGLLCKTSRVYTSGRRIGYWFGIPAQYKVLATAREFWVAFGCGSPKAILLVPYDQFLEWTYGLNVTTRENGELRWHIHIHEHDGQYELRRKKGFDPVDLTPYLLNASEG
ncbi:MAG TPA: hypothetical protein VMW27_14040 [Thermoanaerobaculia bacterium]|nr:hypothetical protein [Thermoanaerobaculia bacterium]